LMQPMMRTARSARSRSGQRCSRSRRMRCSGSFGSAFGIRVCVCVCARARVLGCFAAQLLRPLVDPPHLHHHTLFLCFFTGMLRRCCSKRAFPCLRRAWRSCTCLRGQSRGARRRAHLTLAPSALQSQPGGAFLAAAAAVVGAAVGGALAVTGGAAGVGGGAGAALAAVGMTEEVAVAGAGEGGIQKN